MKAITCRCGRQLERESHVGRKLGESRYIYLCRDCGWSWSKAWGNAEESASKEYQSRGLITLARFIRVTRSTAVDPLVELVDPDPVAVAILADSLVVACANCDQRWDRLTCAASWGTIMAIVGHRCVL